MAKPKQDQEHEWIKKARSGGAVPFLEHDQCSDYWSSPPGNSFLVRGPEYLKTKGKIPGGECLLKPLGFDWIKGPTKISELLNNPKNRIRTALEDERSKGHKPFVWAFNLQLPNTDHFSIVSYFVALEHDPDNALIKQFLKGDDGFRNSRLKLIANVVKGPWIVRKSVGEQAICVVGRVLSSTYVTGDDFMEVDIDVGSSMAATAVFHLAFGYFATLTVDLAFLIEGRTEQELPERILGGVRFSNLDAALARQVELPSGGNSENSQSSLRSRVWKSIEHLLKTQDSDSSFSERKARPTVPF